MGVVGTLGPAEAACQLVTATASEGSPAEAARTSQALVVQSANELKRARRWAYLTLYAHRVKGDPFWKAVRPNGVPPEAQIKPDIVTSRFYTTCFTGVVVPYVCTTGSAACGQ
ncbi:hypothetical protein [Methyloceanibacter sp.]|uniref:hypothetical protein n=1 Tax=Methyloceanibacter sp. TaxID=1965321 RepID=UPI002D79802A|nr:hypothetical protein [Methyloceanibacter sp.]